MKLICLFISLLCFSTIMYAQDTTYPEYDSCKGIDTVEEQKQCFESSFFLELKELLEDHPKYKDLEASQVSLVFDVDKQGVFNLIFIDAKEGFIRDMFEDIFNNLSPIQPAKAYGNHTYMQFNLNLELPLEKLIPAKPVIESYRSDIKLNENPLDIVKQEIDSINSQTSTYDGELYNSYAFIPLSHEIYNRFDKEINLVGTNFHSAQKPFSYKDVKKYYDFKTENKKLSFNKTSWFGRKFFDEHFATVKSDKYWLAFDIGVDLQAGRDTENALDTYNNTRIGFVQGGIGKKFTFYGAIFESQGRFADYFNRLANSRAPADGYPAVVPSRGVAKEFGDNGFDYPVTVGYLNYRINDNFNLQVGNHKNFIGDGYRSLFLSDNASPVPFVKADMTFWKLKYTNIWMQARNTNILTEGGAYQNKFIAMHHLSYNVNKRLNIGIFEAALWDNEAERGFDISYLNPLLFYQMVEFSTGTEGGKVMVGLNYKYKWTDSFQSYGQLLIDELSVDDVFGGDKSYKNKFGVQLGVKYFDAFKVKDLDLQLEYNQVRPFTYSHFRISTNYTHAGQSLAHLWGANFRELIAIARYRKNRWLGHAKLIYGLRGFEPEDDLNPFYGSDLFGTERNIFSETGVEIGQGNKVNSFFAEAEVGYLVNPATNFKLYVNVIARDFSADIQNSRTFDNNTVWINFGLRTDLFNWYFDY